MDEGFQVDYNIKSWITVSVMCQDISVNEGIMMEGAVEHGWGHVTVTVTVLTLMK